MDSGINVLSNGRHKLSIVRSNKALTQGICLIMLEIIEWTLLLIYDHFVEFEYHFWA